MTHVFSPAVLQHLGTLHGYETVLVLVIAFGPFLVIAAMLVRERRRSGATGRRDEPSESSEPSERLG